MAGRSADAWLFYTYVWRTAEGAPFYVGKGRGARAYQPTNSRSKEFSEIFSRGGCTVEIVDEFTLESQAHANEMELIERYGLVDLGSGPLVNKTGGGEGTSGVVRSVEHRAKLSMALLGRPLPPERRAAMSAGQMGRKMSPEAIAKTAAAHRGKSVSAETRAKMSAVKLGKTHSLGSRAQMAASQRFRGPMKNGTSGYKGVAPKDGKWVAKISVDGEARHLGRFSAPEDAAKAYDLAAVAAWGGECYLNFEYLRQAA